MYKIILSSFFALFLFSVAQPVVAATTTAALNDELQYLSPIAVEAEVREYFADTPVMIEIARCESKFRQYTDGGSVLRGGSGSGMIGVFQFFESIHTGAAADLGYDLTSLDGNLAYAKHIYDTQGTTPWNSAKSCWNIAIPVAAETSEQAALQQKITLLLQIIELLKQIQTLQNLAA